MTVGACGCSRPVAGRRRRANLEQPDQRPPGEPVRTPMDRRRLTAWAFAVRSWPCGPHHLVSRTSRVDSDADPVVPVVRGRSGAIQGHRGWSSAFGKLSAGPKRSISPAIARSWSVFVHHSPAVSPGRGIIGANRISCATSTRAATSGPANAPSDCATTVSSLFEAPQRPPRRRGQTASPAHRQAAAPALSPGGPDRVARRSSRRRRAGQRRRPVSARRSHRLRRARGSDLIGAREPGTDPLGSKALH